MIIVALIVLVACAVVILGAIFGDPSQTITLSFFDMVDAEVSSIGAFLIGLITGAVTLAGLWLLFVALRRARHKSVERRQMEKRHEELEKEKAELEHKLGRDRVVTDPLPAEPGSRDTYGISSQPRSAADEEDRPDLH